MQRAQAALVVRGDGDGVEDAVGLGVAEAVGEQALARASLDQALRAGTRGDALGLHADQPPGAVLGGDRGAQQRVHLLGLDARLGCRLVLGIAGGDRDLGEPRVLALAHALGDVLGERLGLERRLSEDDLADDVVDDLLEARHVRALLVVPRSTKQSSVRVVELLGSVVADPDDLLDVRHADPRERNLERRALRLDVGLAEGGLRQARRERVGNS